MAAPIVPSFARFDTGIVNISRSQTAQAGALPTESGLLLPSDSRVESQLPKLWKVDSLQNMLQETLAPLVRDRDNLSPQTYKKKLQDAKDLFKKLAEEEKYQRKDREGRGGGGSDSELFEQVVEDFDEIESNQDLLWLLRQVVHIA